MRRFSLVTLIIVTALTGSLVMAEAVPLLRSHLSAADPCDSYGDCVSSTISYTRANPDDSLYLGDQLTITLTISLGSGSANCGSGCTESWSGSLSGVTSAYNSSEFKEASLTKTSAAFTVIGNSTGTYTIGATSSFSIEVNTCTSSTTTTTSTSTTATTTGTTSTATSTTTSASCKASSIQTSLTTIQQVSVIQLRLQLAVKLANVTDTTSGYLLRNPDGSFYRNDSFCATWSGTFQYASSRPDIKVNATSVPIASLQSHNSTSDGRTGMFCYQVALDAGYQPYNLTLDFKALNWQQESIAHRMLRIPFAVVRYNPMLTYFTYMDYNSPGSSTYERPFVTLVRYGGNRPGYTYNGDNNTERFTSTNSTGERALMNNFTFWTTGWNATVHFVNANIGHDVNFSSYPASIRYQPLNRSFPLVTWADRIQKYYFRANTADFKGHVSDGTLYYNLTESANSKDFAGSTASLFNTTYIYEPLYYSGYLTFNFYDANGKPDQTANVTIVSHNPSPLNVYLAGREKARFGNDRAVYRAFSKDLYPSNYTTTLKQLKPNLNGSIVYLVNQTNLAMPGASAFPSFNVTVSSALSGVSYQYVDQPPYLTGGASTFCAPQYKWWEYGYSTCTGVSYQVPNVFSLFLVNGSALPSLPFENFTAYYLATEMTNLMLPMNSTLPGGPVWYANWYANTTEGEVINANLPISVEPGTLTKLYQFVYGQNSTADVNTSGGGIGFLPEPQQEGSYYHFTLLVNPQSGGLARIFAVDSAGTTLDNGSIYPTTPSITSFSPPGFFGVYTTTIPVIHNGTVTITLMNAWGARTTIGGIPTMVIIPPQPLLSWNFTILMTVILLGIGALASLLRWREARRKET